MTTEQRMLFEKAHEAYQAYEMDLRLFGAEDIVTTRDFFLYLGMIDAITIIGLRKQYYHYVAIKEVETA